jgi:hypothetical protein
MQFFVVVYAGVLVNSMIVIFMRRVLFLFYFLSFSVSIVVLREKYHEINFDCEL